MKMLIRMLIALLILPCLLGHSFAVQQPTAAKPNIVVILADDMGYGDLSCNHPDSKIQTPHLDRLAAEGVRFTDAHSGGSSCIPSRYALMTGRFAIRASMSLAKGPLIEPDRMTVASMLREQGYATSMVGKWHLGFEPYLQNQQRPTDYNQPLRGGPVDCGFDSFFGMHASLDLPPYFYIRDRSPVSPPTENVTANSDVGGPAGWNKIQGAFWRAGKISPDVQFDQVTPRFFDEAVKVINQHAAEKTEQPLFLYLALPSPHTPWMPLEKFQGQSGAGSYGDFVMQVDAGTGRVMQALRDAGLDRDTLVLFSSDNGPVWYDKDVEKYGHRSVGPLRGMKFSSWEGGHRMPFLVRWPNQIEPGKVCDQTIAFSDVLATFAHLTGLKQIPAGMAEDSVSFHPYLIDPSQPPAARPPIIHDAQTIRDGDWKLILPKRGQQNKPAELYNLKADLSEQTNLYQQQPEVAQRLESRLKSFLSDAKQPAVNKPSGQPTTAAARSASWDRHVRLQQTSPFKHLRWRSVGPRKSSGRIEAIACPVDQPEVMYVGVGSGGLWKTVNHGTTWKPIFQHQPTCAIGDVAVAPSDSEVVWLGTGEVLMARSALHGMGVFKSTDAGQTWQNMGLQDTHHIGRVLIDPTDANTVYVAAIGHQSTPNQNRGIFKTSDGGQTWQNVLFIDEQTSAIDLVIDPADANTLYATTWQRDVDGQDHYGPNSGIYKSTDAGQSWSRLTEGLPQGDFVGRIGIDIADSNSQVLYAIVDCREQGDGIYRSDDAGACWRQVNQTPIKAGWDWCEVRVSPDNENAIYSIGQNSFFSNDGGKTFNKIGGTIVHLLDHPSRILHLDTHAMWIDPDKPNHIVFGNDGGLFVSYDRGENWLHLNNLPISEVYAVTYDSQQPYNIYIGTQDNAALFGPSTHVPVDGAPDPWQHVYLDPWGGGDSYFTYRDPGDSDTIYYEHQYGELMRKQMSTQQTRRIKPRNIEGQPPLRFAWMTPYFPSRHDDKTLYLGANRVFKSINRGDDWNVISPDLTLGPQPPNIRYNAITTLSESNLVAGLLFAGSDTGNLFVTENDGRNWQSIDSGLPRLPITRVTPSPHQSDTVFVTLSGLNRDDFSAYVFRSDDRGQTWRSISQGLPLETAHVIHEDPLVQDLLYLGTDLGVYVSTNGGDSWQSLCNDLPTASVQDLFVHPREGELVIGTHGLSVFVLEVSSIQQATMGSR